MAKMAKMVITMNSVKNLNQNKILRRLILYFFTSFLLFSLVNSVVFFLLFSAHNVTLHKAELERRVKIISETLSEIVGTPAATGGHGHGHGGMGMGMGMGRMGANINNIRAYLAHVDGLAMGEIWVVDENFEIMTFGHGHMQMTLSYGEIPLGTEQFILAAFDGTTIIRQLDNQTISAATPIFLTDGTMAGVILLHSQISDIDEITATGANLLFYSTGTAAIMAVILAVLFSAKFTKPLNKMKRAALKISSGDYSAKTGVIQADEVGELANILDNMAIKLDIANKESQKTDKLRKDFTANISHELRTPVTVMRASLEALCDGIVSDPAKVEEYHKQMLFETVHLERLIADLLELSKLQNPDFIITMQQLNPTDVLQDVIRSMQQMAATKNIFIDFTDETAADFCGILGDYGRLRQMFMIVLDNAIKFSAPSGTVKINLANRQNRAIITISDQGCGISPEDLPHIFDRFYMQRSEKNKKGSGLGLAIAKQIADRHGVEITVSSALVTQFLFDFKSVGRLPVGR